MCTEKYHEKETLEYYCQECQVCICIKCGVVNHDRHPKMDIEQAAEEQKVQLMDAMEKMKAKIMSCENLMKQTKESFEKAKEDIFVAQTEVRKTVEELISGLQEHETAMITKLNDIYETLKNDHEIHQNKLELLKTQLKRSVEYSEAILKRNIASEVLKEKDSVLRRFDQLVNVKKLEFKKFQQIVYVSNVKDLQNLRVENLGKVICISYTDPSLSVAYGNGLQVAEVGKETQFTIETKDSEQKRCYSKDKVTVSIKSATGEELEMMIQDKQNGNYSVTYTPACVGQHDVLITVNGEPLACCPLHVQVTAHQYQSVFAFGSRGTGQGQFKCPCDIAVSKRTGNIAVADYNNKRIQMFSPKGKYITEFGQEGPGAEGVGFHPTSVAFTLSGDIIVSHRSAFNEPTKLSLFSESGQRIKQYITNKYLKDPYRVSVGGDGQLIVCDAGDDTIKVLSPDGTNLLQAFTAPDCAETPTFAVYHQDKFFVSYFSANCVKVFDKKGMLLYDLGSKWSDDGQFNGPAGLVIDWFNCLVVCDRRNRRLQAFTADGKFVATIDGRYTGLRQPHSVAVFNDGNMFVIDWSKDCVHVFH